MSVTPDFAELLKDDSSLTTMAGVLFIDGLAARSLVEEYGTPLFVVSQSALAANYSRLRTALDRAWPGNSDIFFSVKSNPNLAVSRFFARAGAGMDVFSANELRAAALAGGKDVPIVLNGSAKEPAALRLLAEVGGTVNIDSVEEIDALEAIATAYHQTIDVNIRLKPESSVFAAIASDYFGVGAGQPIMQFLDDEKWGFSVEGTIGIINRLSRSSSLRLKGFSSHIGRISTDPAVFELYGRSLAGMVEAVRKATGFVPQVVDAGGGWPRRRDPESRAYQLNNHDIEEYVAAFATGYLGATPTAAPDLWIEPGRYLVGSAVTLLTKVIARKADLNRVWITVDTSTNHLARVDTSKSRYFVLPVENDHSAPDEYVEVVGPTCVHSVLASRYRLPRLEVGSLVAILDAGMYAESAANNFNMLPRPACVYVAEGKAALIRRAETFEDIMRPQLDVWEKQQ